MAMLTNAYGRCEVGRPDIFEIALHFPAEIARHFGVVSPNRSLICVVKIVTAIPLVNPTTIRVGDEFDDRAQAEEAQQDQESPGHDRRYDQSAIRRNGWMIP